MMTVWVGVLSSLLIVLGCGTSQRSNASVVLPPPSHDQDEWSCPDRQVENSLRVSYHRFGDYCEGMYLPAVSSTTLVTVSLTESVGDVDLRASAPIRIEWPGTLPGLFHLQGTWLGNSPYDLDVKPSPQPWFEWPTTDVRKIARSVSELGFLVWRHPSSDEHDRPLYFPVNVGQGVARGARHPRLVVVPGTQLERVTVSLGALDPSDHMAGRLIDARSAGSMLYPADEPIVLPLEELAVAPTGFYVVEIKAKASNGALVAALYHRLYHEL